MLVAGNYGCFRDELYYLADGRHLQAGYVDQPLLMGWLAALLRVTVGDSLVAIHRSGTTTECHRVVKGVMIGALKE
jgi:hypothetical protein